MSLTGSIDAEALTELACNGHVLAEVDADELWEVRLEGAFRDAGELPVAMRTDALPDDDEDRLLPHQVRAAAGGRRAVAMSCSGARPTRWVYLGVFADGCHGGLSLGDQPPGLWDARVAAATAHGAVRVVADDPTLVHGVLLDGGTQRVAVYLGFDGEQEEAVAIVLDAERIGGMVDERDGEESLRETQLALVEARPGEHRMDWPRRFEGGFCRTWRLLCPASRTICSTSKST